MTRKLIDNLELESNSLTKFLHSMHNLMVSV